MPSNIIFPRDVSGQTRQTRSSQHSAILLWAEKRRVHWSSKPQASSSSMHCSVQLSWMRRMLLATAVTRGWCTVQAAVGSLYCLSVCLSVYTHSPRSGVGATFYFTAPRATALLPPPEYNCVGSASDGVWTGTLRSFVYLLRCWKGRFVYGTRESGAA